jgi:hypothetical protein
MMIIITTPIIMPSIGMLHTIQHCRIDRTIILTPLVTRASRLQLDSYIVIYVVFYVLF